MTVEAQILSEQHPGDGVNDEFEFAFRIESADELVVTLILDATGAPALQTLTTHYTVEIDGDDGTGTVTMVTAPAVGYTLDLRPVYELLQPTRIGNQGRFLAETHERVFDRLTIFTQYLYRLVRRSIRLPDLSDAQSGEMTPIASWLGRYLFINTDGELEPAAAIAQTTLTKSILGGLLKPISAEEVAAELMESDLDTSFDYGHMLRYKADPTGAASSATAFVRALASHPESLVFPGGDFEIDGPVSLVNNTHITLTPNTVVRVPTGGMAADIGWLRAVDKDNITIEGNGALFEFETKPAANENRHIFDLRGASNVTIENVRTAKAGGDGLYIGAGVINHFCEHLYIENFQADNCRRQGISLISAVDCWINGCLCENITGTSPSAGIDIEPNVATDQLKGIRLTKPVTRNCDGFGILAVINDLPAGYELDVTIEGHRDEGSAQGGFQANRGTAMTGRFRYLRPHLVNSGLSAIDVRSWASTSALLEIIEPTIINPNASNNTVTAYLGHGIAIYNPSADGVLSVGNVVIVRPSIVDNRGVPQMKDCIFARNFEATGVISNVLVLDPVKLSGNTAQIIGIRFGGASLLRDPQQLARIDLTASADYGDSALASIITNTGAVGVVTVTLKDTHLPNPNEVTFLVVAAQELRVDPEALSSFVPAGAAGVYLSSNVPGASITLKRDSATTWRIARRVGIWVPSTDTVNPTYSETNVTTARAFDADTVTLPELADIVGTLIKDQRAQRILK